MNITKTFVDKIPIPVKVKEGRTEQKRYYDDKLKGFGLRVTSGGTKAFFVEKLVNGTLKRMTIAHYPEMTTEQARREANALLGKMVSGIDPLAEKKAKKMKGTTLQKAFDDYKAARKNLKPTTINDYERVLKQVVPDWLDKSLSNINKDMIVKRHTAYGESNSEARANLAMRLLRAIFNYAINEYQTADGKDIILENPVSRLSHTRSWYRVDRRQSVIKSHELADWYDGLMRLSDHYSPETASMWQDYFLLVVFSGMRRTEACSLAWAGVDFTAKTFTLRDTKNRDDFLIGIGFKDLRHQNVSWQVSALENDLKIFHEACLYANHQIPEDNGGPQKNSIPKYTIFQLAIIYENGTGNEPTTSWNSYKEAYGSAFYKFIMAVTPILKDLKIKTIKDESIGRYNVDVLKEFRIIMSEYRSIRIEMTQNT